MGRRGPTPKPSAMKALEGNPGKRALNKLEPKLDLKMPSCPKHLSPEAKKEWRRISKELIAVGLLTLVDRAALAAYCQTWARWVEAEEKINTPGFETVCSTDKGYEHVNPWVQVSNSALKQMKAFLTEFGLTPASRSRIVVAQPKEEDPFDEFLRRRN